MFKNFKQCLLYSRQNLKFLKNTNILHHIPKTSKYFLIFYYYIIKNHSLDVLKTKYQITETLSKYFKKYFSINSPNKS